MLTLIVRTVLLLTLLVDVSTSFTHPCQSEKGANSDICKQLRTMCDDNSDLSICETLEERIDVGIAIIEPSAGMFLNKFQFWKEIYHSFLIVHLTWKFVWKTLPDIKLTGAGSFLSSLSNIPSDLLDFYTDFGFHVRRGFQTLQRNLQSNGFIRYMDTGIILDWWNDIYFSVI